MNDDHRAISQLVERIIKISDPLRIVLFGSVARNAAGLAAYAAMGTIPATSNQ